MSYELRGLTYNTRKTFCWVKSVITTYVDDDDDDDDIK
jgi:hypothetical protein